MNTSWPYSQAAVYRQFPIDAKIKMRLLRLLPKCEGMDIRCLLTTAPLAVGENEEREHPYEALSYTWGASTKRRQIFVGLYTDYNIDPSLFLYALPIPVTDNLFNALTRLRRDDEVRVLWIDALCINQADVEERSLQVQNMRSIYRNAEKVVIWLGDCDSNTIGETLAIPQTETMSGTIKHAMLLRKSFYQAIIETTPSWWERAWVWQEYGSALAEDKRVQFGPFELDLRSFEDLLEGHQQEEIPGCLRDRIDSCREGFRKCQSWACSEIQRIRGDGNVSYGEIVDMTNRTRATDPRDKLCAFYSFLGERAARLLIPDYKKTLEEVFADATRAYFKSESNYDILTWVKHYSARPLLSKLPSWAVDFSQSGLTGGFRDTHLRDLGFMIGPSTTFAVRRMPNFDFPDIISSSGFLLDKLWGVVEYDPDGKPWHSNPIANVLMELRKSLPWKPYGILFRARDRPQPYDNDFYLSHPELYHKRIHVQDAVFSPVACENTTSDNDDYLSLLFQAWTRCVSYNASTQVSEDSALGFDHHSSEHHAKIRLLWEQYGEQAAKGSVIVVTEAGFFGIAPKSAARGDRVVLLENFAPLLLRRLKDHYIFIGIAYIHGIMHGELHQFHTREQWWPEREFPKFHTPEPWWPCSQPPGIGKRIHTRSPCLWEQMRTFEIR